jgi:hypothetical protein
MRVLAFLWFLFAMFMFVITRGNATWLAPDV